MGSIKQFKRKWPGLIRQAEKSARCKFQRRPILKLEARRGNLKGPASSAPRPRKRNPYVFVPKTTIKNNRVAKEAVLHELRELLFLECGLSRRQAHLRAKAKEPKGMSWVIRRHCGFKKGIVTKRG